MTDQDRPLSDEIKWELLRSEKYSPDTTSRIRWSEAGGFVSATDPTDRKPIHRVNLVAPNHENRAMHMLLKDASPPLNRQVMLFVDRPHTELLRLCVCKLHGHDPHFHVLGRRTGHDWVSELPAEPPIELMLREVQDRTGTIGLVWEPQMGGAQ